MAEVALEGILPLLVPLSGYQRYQPSTNTVDSLLNPLAPQDHFPLGITWVAHQLLELVAALLILCC